MPDHRVPIISVRKVVKKGNAVKFKDGGGYIMNIATKKKLRFSKGTEFISSRSKSFLRLTLKEIKAQVSAGIDN